MSGIGDINGDGFDDFTVGASFTGGTFKGRVYVYSGQDFSELKTFTAAANFANLGTSIAPIGDVDGDSVPDFLSGAPGDRNDIGAVYVFSGGKLTRIHRASGTNGSDGSCEGMIRSMGKQGRLRFSLAPISQSYRRLMEMLPGR